ncbi:MAG: hypothetical protein KGH94_02945 [Candidatus Micrarchaeota archaeon]|nr:hypothetical protein [Candidatus Micrarchaeota archaeon]
MVRKSTFKQLAIGAWAGVCFGLASVSLLIAFGARFFSNPILFSLIAAVVDAGLLAGGIIGFAISSAIRRSRHKPRRSRRK